MKNLGETLKLYCCKNGNQLLQLYGTQVFTIPSKLRYSFQKLKVKQVKVSKYGHLDIFQTLQNEGSAKLSSRVSQFFPVQYE